MSVEPAAFVDTNVLVYAVSEDDARKNEIARTLLERGFAEGCYAISTQVLLELYVTLTRKVERKVAPAEALDYVLTLTEWPVVDVTADLVVEALQWSQRLQVSAWDAAILAAARRAGCSRVLSEDFGAGRNYEGITVENPFGKREPGP